MIDYYVDKAPGSSSMESNCVPGYGEEEQFSGILALGTPECDRPLHLPEPSQRCPGDRTGRDGMLQVEGADLAC